MKAIKMFFEEKFNYRIIEDVPAETLDEFCRENGLNIRMGDMISTDWAIFSQWYGANNGLNFIESVSFAYMVSNFLSGMGVSASTEMYLREEQIEFALLEKLNELREQIPDEKEQAIKMFESIFVFYKEELSPYWRKTEQMNLRLSIRQLEDFKRVRGDSNSEKLQTLLDNYFE